MEKIKFMFQTTNQTNYEAKWTMIFWWSNVLCFFISIAESLTTVRTCNCKQNREKKKKKHTIYFDGEFGNFPAMFDYERVALPFK